MYKDFEMKAVANANTAAHTQGKMAEDDQQLSTYSDGSGADDSSGDERVNKTSRMDTSTDPQPERKRRRKNRAAGSTIHRQLVTRHEYHDHALDPIVDLHAVSPHRGKGNKSPSHIVNFTTPFPTKLYEMISEIEAQGLSNMVSWQPHGRCFKVHNVPEFKILLQSYFKLSKLASFQRQLNLYGFQRLTVGLDKGSYYHELFLRSRPDLVGRIERVKVKGTGVRAKSNPDDEPKLYSYPAVDAQAAIALINSTTANYANTNPNDQGRMPRVVLTASDIVSLPINNIMSNTVSNTSSCTEVREDINEDIKTSFGTHYNITQQKPCTIIAGLVRNMSSLNVFPSAGSNFTMNSWRNTNMQNATFPTAVSSQPAQPSLPAQTSLPTQMLRNVSSCILDRNFSFASIFSKDITTSGGHANDKFRDQAKMTPLNMDNVGLNKNATIAANNLKADETDDNVSFDRLVEEMFQHDQSIEFPDLIKMATESDGNHPV